MVLRLLMMRRMLVLRMLLRRMLVLRMLLRRMLTPKRLRRKMLRNMLLLLMLFWLLGLLQSRAMGWSRYILQISFLVLQCISIT